MAFPVDADLGTAVELQIGGVWTDITPYAYLGDPITITRGRADQAAHIDPGTAKITLINNDGRFSPRNPLSPYYGKIGRNTPIRVSVKAGSSYLLGPGGTGGSQGVQTPDTSALDIVGDLDVRVDATLDNWFTSGLLASVELAGKFNSSGSQKSWLLHARDGKLHFEWSADGVNTTQIDSTVKLPGRRRLAVRATLDVNNGASGSTVVFYTAGSLTGTWVQLGDPIVTAGVTSIFSGTAPLRVGRASDLSFVNPEGQVWGAEIRNGINGTVVANPDFRTKTPGTTSFTDGTGKVWTVQPSASISNKRVRLSGEVANWPVSWGNGSSMDVRVSVQGAGILRRLAQGSTPLQSTLRRRIPSFSPLGYWPMEEATGATQAYSPIKGVRPMTVSGITFASDSTLAGSDALPAVGSATAVHGTVSPPPAGTAPTSWHVEWVYKLTSPPTSQSAMMQFTGTGSVALWTVFLSAGIARILGQDGDGATVVDATYSVGSDLYDGRWNRWQFSASVSGGVVTWSNIWLNVGGAAGTAGGTYSGTLGRITTVGSPPQFPSTLSGMAIGHVSVFSPSALTAFVDADTGFNGETAGTRLSRLSVEESLPLTQYGDSSVESRMGPQRPAAILDLLNDAADVDGGILYERRNALGLACRDLNGLYNQPVTLALDYTAKGHVAPPLQPVDDDQGIKNDITVTRANGSSARVTLDTGALSTKAPPNGVGPYAGSPVTLNLFDDDQPEQQAGWRLHLGTWDEARYPSVHVNLAKAPALIDGASATDSGDLISIINLPSFLPPDDLLLMVQGYTEIIGIRTWDITYNATPGGPWSTVGVADDPASQADTDGCQLAGTMTTTSTSVAITTTSGPRWADSATYPSDFPFDIIVAGERMTVAGCTGTTTSQTFTGITRSVNGVVKSHLSGEAVSLFAPVYAAL